MSRIITNIVAGHNQEYLRKMINFLKRRRFTYDKNYINARDDQFRFNKVKMSQQTTVSWSRESKYVDFKDEKDLFDFKVAPSTIFYPFTDSSPQDLIDNPKDVRESAIEEYKNHPLICDYNMIVWTYSIVPMRYDYDITLWKLVYRIYKPKSQQDVYASIHTFIKELDLSPENVKLISNIV